MYRVEWLQAALDDLTTLWMRADANQRRAISAASNAVDQRLSINPNHEGESRPGGRRITFVSPLAIRFQIEADGQTVTVLHVRLFGRRQR